MQEQRHEHIKVKAATKQSKVDAYTKKHYVDPGILSDDEVWKRPRISTGLLFTRTPPHPYWCRRRRRRRHPTFVT